MLSSLASQPVGRSPVALRTTEPLFMGTSLTLPTCQSPFVAGMAIKEQ